MIDASRTPPRVLAERWGDSFIEHFDIDPQPSFRRKFQRDCLGPDRNLLGFQLPHLVLSLPIQRPRVETAGSVPKRANYLYWSALAARLRDRKRGTVFLTRWQTACIFRVERGGTAELRQSAIAAGVRHAIPHNASACCARPQRKQI